MISFAEMYLGQSFSLRKHLVAKNVKIEKRHSTFSVWWTFQVSLTFSILLNSIKQSNSKQRWFFIFKEPPVSSIYWFVKIDFFNFFEKTFTKLIQRKQVAFIKEV